LLEVEIEHDEVDALMSVDGSRMGARVRSGLIDRAQQGPGARLHEGELAASGPADVGQIGSRGVLGPAPSGRPGPRQPLLDEVSGERRLLRARPPGWFWAKDTPASSSRRGHRRPRAS